MNDRRIRRCPCCNRRLTRVADRAYVHVTRDHFEKFIGWLGQRASKREGNE